MRALLECNANVYVDQLVQGTLINTHAYVYFWFQLALGIGQVVGSDYISANIHI
jgi:hypothetical protein